MEERRPIERAQIKINQALAELEAATDGYVRGIEIMTIDARTMTDDRPQHRRHVQIDLEPKPGSDWGVSAGEAT